jgi:Na+:H+ antiporter, NhaA family
MSRSASRSGITLLVAAATALLWANSRWSSAYFRLWQLQLSVGSGHLILSRSLNFWISDGLMPFFFLLVGLEIRREMHDGTLANAKAALLPVIAAMGGIIVPALLYAGFNREPPLRHGWAIPTATDIAFATGVLALLGRRISPSLRVLLLTIAVIDDIVAILLIACFYSKGLTAGAHPALAGVIIGLLMPMGLVRRMERRLYPWVSFAVMPLYAFANAGVSLHGLGTGSNLSISLLFGVTAGLVIGKPLGITLSTALCVRAGWCELPEGIDIRRVFVIGCIAGVGFTMSIFICHLAFVDAPVATATLGVLIASAAAALVGLIAGRWLLPVHSTVTDLARFRG